MTPTIVPSDFSPELTGVAAALKELGKTPADCVRAAQAITYQPQTHRELAGWKRQLQQAGLDPASDALERVVIYYASLEASPRIDSLRVHPGVKALFRKEFQTYANPPANSKQPLLVATDPFITSIYIATLRRFPAGPMDWMISGFPRSWLGRIPPQDVPRTLWYLLSEFGGFRPAFYVHLAYPPRNRSLVIAKEVRRAYYRMACSLMLQPEMKGIMCSSWFHDPSALKDAPHLAALNEPYLQHGGRILTTTGEAREDSGFLKHSPDRRKLYQEGKLRIRLTVAMWPRAAAIQWAQQHPEFDT